MKDHPSLSPAPETSVPSRHDEASAKAVYSRAIRLMKTILQGIDGSEIVSYQALHDIILAFLKELENNRNALVALARQSTAGNYLYAHSVNVAVLSLNLAENLRWETDDLVLLGIGALLHDVGMRNYMDLANQPRPLTQDERLEIQRHPLESEKLVDRIRGLDAEFKKTVKQIVKHQHERASGHGYPEGLQKEELHQGAQILGLCDVYEAMTHHRNWRQPLLPHDVLKQILRNTNKEFDPKLIKAFLDRMSLFPPGSFVQLSSGEVARVVNTHPQFPTRPTVDVWLRADGSRQDPPILLDIPNHPLVHVTRPVDETKLNTKDKKLLMQLEAARWWVD